MNPAELQPHQLMQRMADFFEEERIAYHVVGSMASMIYGEPRFTNDVDIVAEIPLSKADSVCKHFAAPEYYVSDIAIRDAILRRSQFNILHPPSGLKADIILPPDSDFARTEATRVQRKTTAGNTTPYLDRLKISCSISWYFSSLAAGSARNICATLPG